MNPLEEDCAMHKSIKFQLNKLAKLLYVIIGAFMVPTTINVILALDSSATPASANKLSDASLQPRVLQTVITATNTNDSGAGSLRQAIMDAATGDTIRFAPSVSGTIALTTGELVIMKSLTIQGPGPTLLAVSGSNATRVFFIDDASVSINSLTIRDGNTLACGGGLCVGDANLVLSDTVVISNSGGLGGGINNYGTTTIINSSILSNTSIDTGGGINNNGDVLVVINSTVRGNRTFFAPSGGIHSYYSATNLIWNSTIANNRSARHAGGLGIGPGATVVISNTTISGNVSESDGGGGLDVYGTAWIFNSTVVNNAAVSGGGIRNLSGSVSIKNSIVADNPSGSDCVGMVQSAGHNLSSSATCNFTNLGDKQNVAPQLGPLTDNGGPTPTHLLLAGSPAINAGDNTDCPVEDQRGIPRPQGGICDIGAVEVAFPHTLYLPMLSR
jgi:hypothetical protein